MILFLISDIVTVMSKQSRIVNIKLKEFWPSVYGYKLDY